MNNSIETRHYAADTIFPFVFFVVIIFFLGTGGYLRLNYSHKIETNTTAPKSEATTFYIPDEIKEPPPVKEVVPEVREKKPEPVIDLTQQKKVEHNVELREENSEPEEKEEVRPVYGLKRVYSSGIGSGGSKSDAVIGKLGNTIEKEFDTLTATDRELTGKVVSAATVTSAPRFKRQVRPEYTEEMLENKVEGVIRVRVLVDVDGRVKKAILLNDLGHESGAQALQAVLQTVFHPAIRDDEPVAVWIVVPIRFVMLG